MRTSSNTDRPALLPGPPPIISAVRQPVRRVLMTADAVGGIWQYALDLSSALARDGVEVLVAVMGPPPGPDQRADASRLGVSFVEGNYRLEWMDDPWKEVAGAGEWLLELERSFAPDLVHLNGYCHAALPWRRPAIVVAHSCVRSWWRAVHGVDAPPAWDRYAEAVADGLKAARCVVAPTMAMLAGLREHYGAFGPTCVIPNGRSHVDAMPPDLPDKSPLVFSAGRLWDQAKNIEALCEVAPDLKWPVYVAGEIGDPHGRDTPKASVHYLGRLSSDALCTWYGRASIYALPARYEPFGLSVLEAAASGCALVLGDIPSLRENWSGAAVFVPPHDGHALSTAIDGLIADPLYRTALARRAMRRARQFSVARMAEAYGRAYDLACGTAAA